MQKKASSQTELSALDVKLIQWDELPFRSNPEIMKIWGPRDAIALKKLIDEDEGVRDAVLCARIRGDEGKPILFARVGRKSPHFGRAVVISVGSRTARIKPFGRHRQIGVVELTAIHIWKSKQRFDRRQ